VEDFVEFLRHRGQDPELARSAATVSSPALEAIWNNPEDDVYDAVLVRGRGPRPVSVYEPSHGVTQVGVVAGWAFEKAFQERAAEPQVPPLRFAPVGMSRSICFPDIVTNKCRLY
jgi:hypothetical protein